MLLEKKLNIKEILREMNRLRKRFYSLATILQKRINPLKGITYKDIQINGGGGASDIMTNNLIKIEEDKETLESIRDSYNSYRNLAIDRIIEMQEEKTDAEMIVFFRDELHWKWKDIARIMSYSERHCRRLYNQEKDEKSWAKN